MYPARLGYWPAAAGILAFVWIELVWSQRDDPSALATVALIYPAVQLLGMSLYGVAAWSERADAFGVYSRCSLASRRCTGPMGRCACDARSPAAPGTPELPGLVALLCVMIGSTSFDGFTLGSIWPSIAPDLQSAFGKLGFASLHAGELAFTVGLLGGVAVIRGVLPPRNHRDPQRWRGPPHRAARAALRAQRDPDRPGVCDCALLRTARLPGSGDGQVIALVTGHAAGLTLAHDRALASYDSARLATRSQYWMLGVMVAFASLALWLLSAQA